MSTKYQMHIAGPDDIHEFDDELEALRQANIVNRMYLKSRLDTHPDGGEYGDRAPLLIATVTEKENT